MATSGRLIVSGITVTPAGTSILERMLTIESAKIQLADTGDIEAPVWEQALRVLQESIGFVPISGSVQSLEICLKDCIRGQLSWQRSGDFLRADFHPENRDITVNIVVTSSIEEPQTLPGVMINLFSYDSPLYLATLAANSGSDDLKVAGTLSFNTTSLSGKAMPIPLMAGRQEGFDAEFTTLRAALKGKAPLDSKIDLESAISDWIGHAEINADLAWKLTLAETSLNGSQHHKVAIDIYHGALKTVLESPLEISVDNPFIDEGDILISSGSLCLLDLKAIRQTGLSTRCSSTGISVTANLDDYALSASADSAKLNANNVDWSLTTPADVSITDSQQSMMTGKINLAVNNRQITLNSNTVNIFGMAPYTLDLRHDLTSSKGRGTLNAHLTASQLTGMAEYLNIDNLNINNGRMSIASALEWDISNSVGKQDSSPVTEFSSSFATTNLDLTIDGYDLEGGSISANLAGWPIIASSQPITMSWRLLNIGVPIRNIDMTFDMIFDTAFNSETGSDKQSLLITGNSLVASVFGGELNSTKYDYEAIAGNGDLNLLLSELDLHEILKLQQEELHSTGKISGSVPVQVRQGKLSVSLGNIRALQPGGVIQYIPSESVLGMLAGNEQLQLVVDTMRDFQYHSLEVSLEYSPEGDLLARTSLKGSNPDVENGREIHLNLNLEENLSALLMSLRLSDDISQQLIKGTSD